MATLGRMTLPSLALTRKKAPCDRMIFALTELPLIRVRLPVQAGVESTQPKLQLFLDVTTLKGRAGLVPFLRQP
jgi:hypothetical protein